MDKPISPTYLDNMQLTGFEEKDHFFSMNPSVLVKRGTKDFQIFTVPNIHKNMSCLILRALRAHFLWEDRKGETSRAPNYAG